MPESRIAREYPAQPNAIIRIDNNSGPRNSNEQQWATAFFQITRPQSVNNFLNVRRTIARVGGETVVDHFREPAIDAWNAAMLLCGSGFC